MIAELEFKSLALQGFNHILLIAEAFSDLDTPLLYLKLDGEIMDVRHRELPIQGVQFHLDSILIANGHALEENLLEQMA